MVKRKSPIIPITIVVIGLSVAFAVNTQMHPKDPQEEAKAAQQQQEPETRPVDKKEDLQRALAADPGQGKTGAPQLKMGATPSKGGNPMVAEKPSQYHPKPSSTSTDSQWYQNR